MGEAILVLKKIITFKAFFPSFNTASKASLMVWKLSTPDPPKIAITVMNGVEFRRDWFAAFLF